MQTLLAAGRERRVPDGARERVWAALTVGVAAGAAATTMAGGAAAKVGSELALGSTTAAGAASTGGGAGVAGASAKGVVGFAVALGKAKVLAIGAVVATTAAATTTIAIVHADRPEDADRVTAQPALVKPPAMPAAMPEQANVDTPETRAAADEPMAEAVETVVRNEAPPRSRRAATATGIGASVSPLREEAALLGEARAALRRGDHEAARAKLEQARARFPSSQLAPERDALEVRLASESGDHERAARLARAFAERYPDSPLRSGIESIAHAAEKD